MLVSKAQNPSCYSGITLAVKQGHSETDIYIYLMLT